MLFRILLIAFIFYHVGKLLMGVFNQMTTGGDGRDTQQTFSPDPTQKGTSSRKNTFGNSNKDDEEYVDYEELK
jgi:hypothetical protein